MKVTKRAEGQFVRVVRTTPDSCALAVPRGKVVRLSTVKLALDKPIFVENPLLMVSP